MSGKVKSVLPVFFTGDKRDLNFLDKNIWFCIHKKDIPIIRSVDFNGYDTEIDAFIFNKVIIKNGIITNINKDGYLELQGDKIKVNLDIPYEFSPSHNIDWLDDFISVFGTTGIIALCFWCGSLFVDKIRAKTHFYPFLEITGSPGSGKTMLLNFLWRLFGLAFYEGVKPSSSSYSAIERQFSSVSNLPICLIEGTADLKKFHDGWGEFKNAYSGASIKDKGVKTSGNEVKTSPFKGVVVIVQNLPIVGRTADNAILTRLFRLNLGTDHHRNETRAVADKIKTMVFERLNGFLPYLTKFKKQFDEDFTSTYDSHRVNYSFCKQSRTAEHFGLLVTLLDFFGKNVFKRDFIKELGGADAIKKLALKHDELCQAQHPVCYEFWSIYEQLVEENINHSKDKEVIAVNYQHFMQVCRRLDFVPTFNSKDLLEILPTSKDYKYISSKKVRSTISTKIVHCHIYQKLRD